MLYTLKNNGLILDHGESRGFWGGGDEKSEFYDSWKLLCYVISVFGRYLYKFIMYNTST